MSVNTYSNRHPSSRPPAFKYPETRDERRVLACQCPRCDGQLVRIRRRLIDRLYSLVVPVRRFRCGTMGCTWKGNLGKDKYLAGADPGTVD